MRKYVRKYWKLFSTAVLFLALEALCDLLQPTIMSKIIDVGVADKNLQYVLKMGGLMLLITAFGAIAASLRSTICKHCFAKLWSRVALRFIPENPITFL